MNRGRKIWSIFWRTAVCGLLLFWIFHAIFQYEGKNALEERGQKWEELPRSEQWRMAWTHGPAGLWRNLRQISPGALAGGTLLAGLTVVIGVLRWRAALEVQGIQLPLSRTLEISFVAQFFNSFLLGSTGGDLIKAFYAARETHHKKPEAAATVFADRLVGLWAMLLFAGAMMLPNLSLLRDHEVLAASSAIILGMLAACTVLGLLAFRGGLSQHWPGARAALRKLPKGEWLERSLESCRIFGRRRDYLARAFGLSMLLNLVCVAQFVVIAAGLGATASLSAWLLIIPVVLCIAALPVTPSGLGVRENLLVLMLAVDEIRIPATTALSISLLAYAGMLFWSLVGGLVYLTFRQRHHLAEVAVESPEQNSSQ